MAELWGPRRKFSTLAAAVLALAEAEHELGLLADDGKTPRVRPEQHDELRRHLDDIDFAAARARAPPAPRPSKAHIETFGEACPGARDIIHLGATSCYVTTTPT